MTIHPQYWSLDSIRRKLVNAPPNGMTDSDLKAYSLLDVKGKRVLDAGSWEGDSAYFFLRRGASFVYCIEIVKEFADKIRLPRTKVINEAFDPEKHLFSLGYDVGKIDIEGSLGEIKMLRYSPCELKPFIVEVHGRWLIERFLNRGWALAVEGSLTECNAIVRNFT